MSNDYLFIFILLTIILTQIVVMIALYVILRKNSYKNYNVNDEPFYTESILDCFISGNEEKELSVMISYHQKNIDTAVDYEIG